MSRFAEPPRGSERGEFYIGYLSPAGAATRAFVVRLVSVLVLVAAVLAVALSLLQSRFDPGLFDFGNVTEHRGTLETEPVVRLVPADGSEAQLLVGVGKHAADLDGASAGAAISVRGTTIESPWGRMIEVVDLEPTDATPRGSFSLTERSDERVLDGEIVDSKCFLGVMKPGRGKLHRACASLCIRGGVPPALFVDDPEDPRLYVLVEAEGALEAEAWLDIVGEPVSVRGRTFERGGQWFLETTRAAAARR